MIRKTYRIRILDFSYQFKLDYLNFKYITYEVTAKNEKEALKKARVLYMKGEQGKYSEELPFLLKLFTVEK